MDALSDFEPEFCDALASTSWRPASQGGVTEIIVVDRPADLARLHWEVWSGHWFHETQTRRWYWCAEPSVSNAINKVPEHRAAELCERLNGIVLASLPKSDPGSPATWPRDFQPRSLHQ